jgi:hypothetical protein
MALGALCEQLEKAGEATNLMELERMIGDFDSAMAQVDAEIVRWLAQRQW